MTAVYVAVRSPDTRSTRLTSMPQTPPLKDVSQYKLMGKGLQRLDIPAKVNGEALFGIDAQVPGQKLKYVAVKAPTVPGAKY
jgi:isoquinoline 1-oxidoreductase beta subunit